MTTSLVKVKPPDFRVLTADAAQDMCRLCLNNDGSPICRVEDWCEASYLYENITRENLHDAKQLRAQCCKSCLAQLRKAYVVIGQIRKSSQFWISYLEWNASSVFIAESNTLDKTETIQEIEYKSESEADDVDENSSEPTDPDANSKSESPDALYGDDDDDEIVSEINFKRNFDPIGLEEDRPSVQLQCGYCGQNFEDKSSLMKHFNEVHQKNIEPGHTCNVCNKTFTSRSYYIIHRKAHDITLDNLLKCDKCDKTFHSKTRLNHHQRTVHSINEVDCPTCGKHFLNTFRLKYHMIRHGEKTLQCPETGCPTMFWFSKDMTNHVRTVHRKDRRFICDACGKRFMMNLQLKKHNQRPCNSRQGYNRTKNSDHPDRDPVVCRVCEYTALGVKTLKLHYGRHHPNENWKAVEDTICYICICQFTTVALLEAHRETTHKRCKVCSQFFVCQEVLDRHMERHSTKERAFKCEICPLAFVKQYGLDVHVRRAHTKERPFRCDPCGVAFFDKMNLKMHNDRCHAERVQYVCEICDTSYVKSQSLKRHMAMRHGGSFNWFICQYCDNKYYSARHLTAHYVTNHSGLPPI